MASFGIIPTVLGDDLLDGGRDFNAFPYQK